jgi:hypothetical protein
MRPGRGLVADLRGLDPNDGRRVNATLWRAIGGMVAGRRRSWRWVRPDARERAAHHVIPRAEGGADDPANLAALCARWHGPEEARRRAA